MSTLNAPNRLKPKVPTALLPRLENGDRLDQRTFHERYEAMPAGTKAELIEGVVHVPSPVGDGHSYKQISLAMWAGTYHMATPGTRPMLDGTAILGGTSEPQPDVALRILGGQSRSTDGGCIAGPPELVCEVASATESVDLHGKKQDYERFGVKEYVVSAVRTGRVFWFARGSDGRLEERSTDADGLFRSQTFPGLWLDPAALLREDLGTVLDRLRDGLNSPEHAALVDELAARPRAESTPE